MFAKRRDSPQHQANEVKREQWEYDNYLSGEVKEMVELYEEKGFSTEDATRVIELMSQYRQFFVDHMVVQELGFLPPGDVRRVVRMPGARCC